MRENQSRIQIGAVGGSVCVCEADNKSIGTKC